jgi:CSLREA domain-containing protein
MNINPYSLIKMVLQNTMEFFGLFLIKSNSLRMEGLTMNSRRLSPPSVAHLSFNRNLAKVSIFFLVFALALIPHGQALAVSFTVNSTADQPDANPGDGICRTASNTCTLRAAIMEANSSPGADTITLPAGVYSLGIPSVNDDLDTTGDFDIHTSITILGAGADITIIDAGNPLPGADPTAKGMDRLIEVHPTAGNVTIKDVTLRDGFTTDDGGALQNWSSGLLLLERIKVLNSYAGGSGGGINNANPAFYEWATAPLNSPKSGRIEIRNSALSGNAAGDSGAAVNNTAMGMVSILAGTQVVNNPGAMIPDPAQVIDPLDPEPIEYVPAPGVYDPGAGAIGNQGAENSVGTVLIADSTVSGNFASHPGAGAYNGGSGTLTVQNSTFSDNNTEADGGGLYANGGKVTVTNSTFSENVAANGAGLSSSGSVDSIGLRPNFTISGSTITGNEAHASGGGMYIGGEATLTITNVTFFSNKAHDAGGGLNIADRSGASLSNVTFSDNETHGEGGGAWTGSNRLVTIQNSTFAGNDAGLAEPGAIFDPSSANVAGGGGLYTENGPVTISGSTFENNTATEEGGGIRMDNLGDVTISDSVIRGNHAGVGGGIENSATRVTFERLLIESNRAEGDGGGIYNSSSGLFTILDSTIQLNSGQSGGGLANAPDNHLIIRRSSFLRNTARVPAIGDGGEPVENAGLGGGIYSLADGESLIENTTISGNVAAVGGGGLFHDADGPLELVHLTIWRNSAPMGGGIGVVESDFAPPVPPKANVSVIVRNSIVGGSLQGGSCDWYVTSEGGNLDTGGTQNVQNAGELGLPPETRCFLSAPPLSDIGLPASGDRLSFNFTVDAIANNGGQTLTHALQWGSMAQDAGVSPCPETDQRGVTRPQNSACDIGAYEFVGDPLPFDDTPPETEFLGGPVQDTPLTVIFTFTGSDNLTPASDLQFECRLYETELAEAPEPLAPWDPIPPELWWVGCSSPWQTPLIEAELSLFTFEVRAIDRAGNIDPTPYQQILGGDTIPPDTVIAEMPPSLTNSRSATFTFTGTDNVTPPQFLEFECRLDSRDPDLWLECLNPTFFSNLTDGPHTLEVRAYDGAENVDPTPARYTWTVGQGASCDLANITLTAIADGWVDEVNPLENYLFETELSVRSDATGNPDAVPPEPIVGQNARALFRFALPADAGGCELESATLRLYNSSPTEGRMLQAVPISGSWQESTLTWFNQPATVGTAVTIPAREGYQEWNVTSHVVGMLESGINHGWMIRDASESDLDSGDQAFLSRETPQDPPDQTLPLLVLRYTADGGPPPDPPAPTTTATTVHCGQVLTESTLVANDLIGCLGEGLVIGAPNIVVDLGGHEITSGVILEPGEEDGLLPGIRNGGHTNVVIRNGTVSGFGYGVLLGPGTTHNIVEEMMLTGNMLAGVHLFDADDGRNGNTIRNNTFDHNGETGITLISDSENSVIENNTFIGNGMSIHLFQASGHRIEGNEISGVVLNPLLDSDAGIVLEEGSNRNIMIDNNISDTGDAGIIIHMNSNDNRVEGGVMQRNGDAGVVIADSDRNQVIGILAHGQSDAGVGLSNAHDSVVRDSDLRFNPSGVNASNTNNLLIENNNASYSLQAGFGLGNGLNMQIINNIANTTGGAGISLEGGAFDALGNPVGGALIEGNTTNENGSDGMSITTAGHTIRDNTAYNNFGFGIMAGEALEPGQLPGPDANIDGGGNVANGNAEPEQCVGVVCTLGNAPAPTAPDLTAPETQITGSPLNPTASTSAMFTFTGVDNLIPATALTFECRLDPLPDPPVEPEPPDPEPPDPGAPPEIPEPPEGVGWVECISPVRYEGLEQGIHRFEVRARDLADNFDVTPAVFEWDVDFTAEDPDAGPDAIAPDTRIVSGPSNPTLSGSSATFHFAGTDNLTPGLNLTFQCQIDGMGFAPCASPKNYPLPLNAGSHTFEVYAIDLRGNADQTPATYTWTIMIPPPDVTAPDTFLDSAPDAITVLTSATFAFSSDDPTATFECSLNDSTFSACTSPHTLNGLAAGMHEFVVQARDAAGNTDPTPVTFLWTVSSAPVPTTVFCGQVITQSIIVRNDLFNCLWDGLVVGAPGITIDLDGHSIDGVGIAAGIRNDGYDFVSIKNGIVREFDYGVMLNPGTTDNIVEGMTLESNQEAGIGLGFVPHPLDPITPFPEAPPPTFQAGVRDNILRNNTIIANDTGIWLIHGTRGTLISGNDVSANTKGGILLDRSSDNRVETNQVNASSEPGVVLIGASNNTVLNNTLLENGGGVYLTLTGSDAGYQPSNNNLVQGNIITESGGPALELAGSTNGAVSGNQLIDNVASFSNGEGLLMFYADNSLVRGNDLRGNKAGIELMNSSNNRIESNEASDSEGNGISTGDNSLSNQIIGNNSSNNTGAGISVNGEVAGDAGTLIEGNQTHNNNSYGIVVAKPSHIIKNNFANENGTWGIYSGDPSNGRFNIDGGGNRAQDNLGPIDPFTLQPLNCYNVICTGGDAPPDPIPPDTLILQAPNDPSFSSAATFHFSGSDNVGSVTFECRLDAGTFAPCVSPVAVTVSADTHTFEVRAVDISGNVDPTPAMHTWTAFFIAGAIDTTIVSGPDLTTVQANATFLFSSSENGSTFACSLDGSAPAVCTSPQLYSGLAAGSHTFSVYAIGSAGPDLTPATYTWQVSAASVAAEVGCGEIIVQSTRLLNDLIDCGGHGLIIGANNITIDLDGHLIDGVGLDAGILNNGFDSVTITNGTITQFDYGILLNPGTSLNIIESMRLESNAEAGILLSDADQAGNGNTIRDNTFAANSHGIWLASNTRFTTIRNNAFGGNAGVGILGEFASDNLIEFNEISRSGGFGIHMMGGGNNTIADNSLTNNLGAAIGIGEELLPSNNNVVESNTVSGGAGGILVADSTGNQILFNTVGGTTGPGVILSLSHNNLVRGNDVRANASGISLDESNDNRIEANNASGTMGTGIEIGALSYRNTVVQNAANQNGGEGIAVEDFALAGQGNLIDRNTAGGNAGDGIGVFGVGHTVTGNSAQMNGGWGIYVAVSATDGGGNSAAGNVEPAQCFNIVCTIGTVPGAPETWIVSGPADVDPGTPGIQSNSRNASFTYMASDDATALIDLVFECRLDTTNDLAWEDCEYPAEFLNLSAGAHVFEIRAVDQNLQADPTPARFEWTYVPLPSGVAPEVILDIVPPNPSMLFEAVFTFHANEPDVTFECRVDLFGYEPCGFEGATFMSQGAYEAAFEATQVGDHTFYVRAIDFEGNVGEPVTYTWSILGIVTTFTDGPGFTPGETPFDPPTGGPVASTTATLDFIANVADATYECSLDLGPFLPCTPPVTYTGLIAGEHMLRVIATDLATGAEEMEAAVYEWEIVEFQDVTPPDTSIERAPADNSSATIFEFIGTDDMTPPALLTFECRVDSTNNLDWFACVSPFNLLDMFTYADPQMAPGQHTFEVRAIDIAEPLDPNSPIEGNTDPTPASYTWMMVADTTAPGTGILSGPAATVGEGQEILFEFFGTDNATPVLDITFECSVDTGPFELCGSPESVQGLLPGPHTFRLRAVDLAGNADPTPATRTFTVMAAPVTTITSGPAGRIIDGVPQSSPSTTESAVFVFTADQPGSTFECSLNGSPFTSCTSPRAHWVVTSGTHEFEVRATNPEGVVESEPAVYIWAVDLSVDSTPPNTTITSGPTDPSPSTVATFLFSGSDNRTLAAELTFECALDGTAYNSCVAPQQFSDLTHGSHTMLIRAVDAAGNFDPTPASYTWFVELPPATTILTGPEELTESTDATFTFQSNIADSTFQCWLDGVIAPCTSPHSYSSLSAGDHLFAVLATGPQGTIELAWAEWEWTIGDTTPPITTFTSAPDLQTESTSAEFAFTANEPNVTFTCSLNGAEPQACTSPVEYPFLWPGTYSFEVVAINPPLLDQFGQPVPPLYEPIPTVHEWTIIDLLAPETMITFGPAATTSSTTAFFGVASDDPFAIIECSLDGTGFSECESPAVFENLLPGAHTLAARAVDMAGNADSSPATHAWTITQAAPNTAVGTNVVVELPLPGGGVATLTFLEVTLAGATTLDAMTGAPPLPAGYSLSGGTFYDINTTAEGEPASLCIPFNPADFPDTAVRLLHFDGSVWVDITTMSDPAGMVCGLPESLSPFALASGSGLTPLASIISGPPALSTSGSATFTFSVDVPDSQALCSLDGLPFTACTSPVTYNFLEEGGHDFQVTAIGPDGQTQLIPSLYEWEIVLGADTTPPDTVITRGAPALTVNYISIFEFSGSDNQTHPLELEFECSLDGGSFETCSSPEEIEVLTAGQHTLAVGAVDLALNVDPTPAVWTWIIDDQSAPDTEITLGPDSETTSTAAIFEFEGFEEISGLPVFDFECSLDNAEFAACTSPYEVTGLSAGPHVLLVRAKDLTGIVDPTPDFYEWLILGTTVDTTPPDTIIVSAPPTDNSGPDVLFGFTSNEPVEGFECSLDGGPYGGCEAAYELLGLSQGPHLLLVRAIDLADPPNVDPTPASHTWNTLGEPDTMILSGPPLISNSFNATFTFSSDQAGATFQCSVNGSLYVPCTSPFLAGPLLEDSHTFEVRAVNQFTYLDGTQVVDQTPATYEWEIADATPPDTTITSVRFLGPLDLIEPNSWEFRFGGEDNRTASFELSFECSLDGGPFEGCDPIHYILLEELAGGTHELQVRAVDDLDNVDPTPAVYTWTTEGEPDTIIGSGPALQTESTEATFIFSSNVVDATFECSLDLALFSACESPLTITAIPFGQHELQVRAVSPLGTQVDLSPAIYEWESGDMTPPVITILTGPTAISGPESTTLDTTAAFTFSADDPAALFQCSLDGSPLTFCESGVTYTGLLAGEHTFEVTATKPNLLVEAIPAIWEWTVLDETAPETTIVSGPASEIGLGTPATFTFSSNEPDATFECSLNGELYAECATPPDNTAEFTGLAAGEHTLLVHAVDPSLNTDATPESYTFTVVGAPLTTIASGPDATTTETTASFTFSADQDGSSYACSLDGAAFISCVSPVSYTALVEGAHTFEVQATNGFGLVEEPPALYEWTVVDGIAPETTIDLTPAATTTNTSATFNFSSNELDVTFQCSLDGAAFAACSSPQSYTGLEVSSHTFEVQAIDAAGNVDPTPASYTWTVEAPEPPNTSTGSNIIVPLGDVTVTFASVTTAGLTTVDVLSSAPALPDGYLTTGALYYDLSTTATYTGTVTLCFDYTPGSLTEPVRLLHFNGSAWVDITTSNDSLAGRVCGETSSLSPFALATGTAAAVPETTITAGPPEFTASTSADFAFSSVDPAATFECALDDLLDWGSCEPTTTFSNLTVGEHILLVRAKNAAGLVDASPASHQWTVTPVPDTFISAMPDDPTESTIAMFEFSSDIQGVTFECALDDSPIFNPCESPLSYTGLAQGEHDFFVRARDADGNVDLTPADHSWEIGDIPAPVTIISGPNATTESTSATFVFSADEPNPFYECSLDGLTYASCVSPKTYNGLALGSHIFQVRILNPNAVAEAPITNYTWTVVDLTLPDTLIDAGPASVTGLAEASFSFHSTEPLSTFECSLDGAAYSSCSSPAAYSGLLPGEHSFSVQATDTAGNPDPSPASFTWTYAPIPEITNLTGTTADNSTEAIFTFTADQPDATFQCSLDAALFTACVSGVSYTGLGDGEHIFLVRAVNSLGIVNASAEEYSWTIDASAPDTTIVNAPPASTTSTSASFTFSSNEAGVIFQCSLDGVFFTDPQSGEPVECLSPFGLADLAVGSHTFEVRAIDEVGNADPTPASHTWTVLDNTAPESTITSGPSGTTTESSATFTFSSSEAGSIFECSLDSAAFATCTSPATVTNLLPGVHTFEVRASDPSGNSDPTAASYTWTVEPADAVAPETQITSQPANPSSDAASFGFTGSDEVTPALLLNYQCRLDSTNLADWAPCASPATYADLSLGEHTFEVRAVDEAGNADPTAASYTWTVIATDTTPPETTIDSAPAETTTDTSATFSFSASETGSTFTCALDGFSTPCASPTTYSGLALGDHTFIVRATDAAGNVDPTAAVHEWTIEMPATPTATPIPPTPTATATNTPIPPTPTPTTILPTATPTSAPVSCTTVTLSANADAWIDSGSTSSNKGTDSILKVQAKSGGNNRALVSFNLPPLPSGCTVQSATLRLYAASWRNNRTLQALRVIGNWTENAVTWANQPATNGTAATTSSGSGYRQWNVTSHVQTMYGGTNNGFLIRDANEGGGGNEQQFHSREKGENMPQLVIVFAPAAAPTATPTSTAVPPTPTPTSTTTSVPPTATATSTATSIPPTPTATAIPPTPTAAAPTATPTSLPPTATSTPTSSESSPTPTAVEPTPTATQTAVPPTATPTATAVPPTATPLPPTPTPVPPTPTATVPVAACTATTVTLSAEADAWVDQNSPGNNFGTDSILKVQTKSGNNFRAFLRFALPGTPAGCVVQSATLRLYAPSSNEGRTLQAWQLDGTWLENELTWTNQPLTIGLPATTLSVNGYNEWDVTTLVQGMYTSTNHGFLIRDEFEDVDSFEQQFHSREKGETMPELVITFAATP